MKLKNLSVFLFILITFTVAIELQSERTNSCKKCLNDNKGSHSKCAKKCKEYIKSASKRSFGKSLNRKYSRGNSRRSIRRYRGGRRLRGRRNFVRSIRRNSGRRHTKRRNIIRNTSKKIMKMKNMKSKFLKNKYYIFCKIKKLN